MGPVFLRRGRALVLGLLLIPAAACSVLLNTSADQCSNDGDCKKLSAGAVCQSGVCVDDPNPSSPQCALSSQCAGSAVCINGFCHPKCTSDAGCGPAEICSTGGGSDGVCMPDYRPAS